DLVAALRPHLVDLRFGVLDDVMKERGGDRLLVLAQLRENHRGTPGMADERLAGAPLLSLVRAGGEAECPGEQLPIDLRVVGLDVRKQLVEELLVFLARFEDRHGKSVLPRFGIPSFCQAALASVGGASSKARNAGDSRRWRRPDSSSPSSSSAKIAAASGGHASAPSRQSPASHSRGSRERGPAAEAAV